MKTDKQILAAWIKVDGYERECVRDLGALDLIYRARKAQREEDALIVEGKNSFNLVINGVDGGTAWIPQSDTAAAIREGK